MQRSLNINPDKCTGCMQCELACSYENYGLFNPARSRIKVFDFHQSGRKVPYTCTQCDEAWCMRACPVEAIKVDAATGAKIVLEPVCVGCKVCTIACPFGTINYAASHPGQWPGRRHRGGDHPEARPGRRRRPGGRRARAALLAHGDTVPAHGQDRRAGDLPAQGPGPLRPPQHPDEDVAGAGGAREGAQGRARGRHDPALRSPARRNRLAPGAPAHPGNRSPRRAPMLDAGGRAPDHGAGPPRRPRPADGRRLHRLHHHGGAGQARRLPDRGGDGRPHGAAHDGPGRGLDDPALGREEGRHRAHLDACRVHRGRPRRAAGGAALGRLPPAGRARHLRHRRAAQHRLPQGLQRRLPARRATAPKRTTRSPTPGS